MLVAEHAELSEASQPSVACGKKTHVEDPPADADLDEWIAGAATPEERANRRGVVGRLREKARQERWEKDHAELLRPLNVLNGGAARSKTTARPPPADNDREGWIQEAVTAEERAKRMGTVGRIREKERQEQWEKDNAKLMRLVNGPDRAAGRAKGAQVKQGQKTHCASTPTNVDATADAPVGELDEKSTTLADKDTSLVHEASSGQDSAEP